MIQIYKASNTDYDNNGDITLLPSSAYTTAELNGSWAAELEHPIDQEGRWKYIVEGAVVKMPSFNGDQLYRIKTVSKSDSGVAATMEPIFYDSIGDCFLIDVRPTGKNGQEALDIMLASNNKYSGSSDITKAATAYYQYMNFMEALNGNAEQSFVNRWGGEILFDNFSVIVNERIGEDHGTELRYGKNIPENGLKEDIDVTDVVTRIYPKAYNGYTMSNNGYVDSPIINNYPVILTRTISFEDVKMREDAQEDDEENGVIICDSQTELDQALSQKCREQYESGIDKPVITITADMILLQNTDQYQDYKILETVSLGDTIHIIHTRLGITTDARVISLEYDSMRKKVTQVTIGDFSYNYFSDVTSSAQKIDSIVRPDGTVMAERVQGILNGIYTQLRLQSTAAQKVDGVAFKVEDTDPESPLYGCMIWGTQGLQISVTRNATDTDWDWTTAITAKGIVANAIVTGLLSDKLGRNYWDLDTGEFRLSSEAFLVDDESFGSYVDQIVGDKIEAVQVITLQLTNEYAAIATDSDGNGGNYAGCSTTAQLYYGTSDVSGAATYKATPSSGVTGTWNAQTRTYTVTNMTTDQGEVTIQATWNNVSISKTFTIVKQKQGQPGLDGIQGPKGEQGKPGRTYFLRSSATVIRKGQDNQLTPSYVTFQSFYRDGDSATSNPYSGLFSISIQKESGSWQSGYTSSKAESSVTYTPPTDIQQIECRFRTSDNVVLDVQTIAVIKDIENLTQEDVFNTLTDNGRIQGIFMQDGQLYINGEYMKANSMEIGVLKTGMGANLYTTPYDDFEQADPLKISYNHGGAGTSIISSGDYSADSQSGVKALYGNKCMRVVTTGDGDNYIYLGDESNGYGCIPVRPGKTYIASCYMTIPPNHAGRTVPCQLYIVEHYGKDSNPVNWPVNSSMNAEVGVWKRMQVSFTAQEQFPYISLRVDIDTNAIVYFDCFQIEEVESAEKEAGPWKPAGAVQINGSNIIAKTIGAEQIYIEDLYALRAKIANWIIMQDYLYCENPNGGYSIIKSDGDVMIAANSPTSTDTTGATFQLFHDGHIAMGDTRTGGARTELYGDHWYMFNSQGYAFQFISAGGLEIYGDPTQNPTPYMDWHYNGDTGDYSVRLRCTGYDTLTVEGGTLNTGSDESLKEDTKAFDKQMENFFRAVNPIYFRYKEGTNKLQFGYSANNIENALTAAGFDPADIGLYSVDEKGIRSLAIGGMDAPNTYMIQILMARVAELEEEIVKLKMKGV